MKRKTKRKTKLSPETLARRKILRHLDAAYSLFSAAKIKPYCLFLLDQVIRRIEELEMEAKK